MHTTRTLAILACHHARLPDPAEVRSVASSRPHRRPTSSAGRPDRGRPDPPPLLQSGRACGPYTAPLVGGVAADACLAGAGVETCLQALGAGPNNPPRYGI